MGPHVVLYRLLLRLFPRSFRDRFGEAMTEVFADRWRAAKRLGTLPTLALLARTAIDAAHHGLAERAAERRRQAKGDHVMTSIAQDIKYAVRSLRLAPGFTIVALTVLTLGIGATTAIFTVVDAVVLRPLPFPVADRLVALKEVHVLGQQGIGSSVAPQNFLDWRAQQGAVFEDLAAVGGSALVLKNGASAEVLQTASVSASLFPMLRVPPELGRVFTADHEVAGHDHVVVISDALWHRRFGGDPHVVGSTVATSTGPWTIVGIMPPGFTFPIMVGDFDPIDGWTPLVTTAEMTTRGPGHSYYLNVVGRLKDGVTLDEARTRMNQVEANLKRAYPAWFEDLWIRVVPLTYDLVGDVRVPMLTLLGAVALVLLIACANVANLVLARSTVRRREIAIRAAIGASRADIMRTVLVENMLLACAASAIGLLLAWLTVHSTLALLPGNLPRMRSIAVNWRVLTMAAGVALMTGLVFGAIPAWQLSRLDLLAILNQESGTTAGTARRRLRTVFIVSEVALATTLVIGAALFLASYERMMRVDTGVDYRQIRSARISAELNLAGKTGEARTAEIARGAAALRAAMDQLRHYPGVDSVALAWGSDVWGNGSASTSIEVPGRPAFLPPANSAQFKAVSPSYFETMGIHVVSGRTFDQTDVESDGAVILNDVAARHFFDADRPLNRPVKTAGGKLRTVVGVVRGVRLRGPEEDLLPEVYLPSDDTRTAGTLYVRVAPGASLSASDIKRAIDDMHVAVSVTNPQSLSTLFDKLIRPRTLNTVLVGVFGALALVIAAIGVYGVMSYVVAQRAREIGVRIALGALPSQIKADVLREAALVLAGGALAGGIGAGLLSRFIGSLLFQVEAQSPALYALAIAVLVAAGLFAAFIPARRAAGVDPIVVLKH